SDATTKLLSISPVLHNRIFYGHLQLTPEYLIRLLAVIAPRLALTVGPYTSEASELMENHFAVLTKTDNDRHVLRIGYPSEPILAEVSARLINHYNWINPL